MTIVDPTNEAITINYFNRLSLTPVNVNLYDESTRITTTISVGNISNGAYFSTLDFTQVDYFVDNRTYLMTIVDVNDKILFKDKIFATTQDVNSYSVNSDVYTTNSTNNEYTIYE